MLTLPKWAYELHQHDYWWWVLGISPWIICFALYNLRNLENDIAFKDSEKNVKLEAYERYSALRIVSDIGWTMVAWPKITELLNVDLKILPKLLGIIGPYLAKKTAKKLDKFLTPTNQFLITSAVVIVLKSFARISVLNLMKE